MGLGVAKDRHTLPSISQWCRASGVFACCIVKFVRKSQTSARSISGSKEQIGWAGGGRGTGPAATCKPFRQQKMVPG